MQGLRQFAHHSCHPVHPAERGCRACCRAAEAPWWIVSASSIPPGEWQLSELHIRFASCRAMPAVSDPAFSLPPWHLSGRKRLSTRSNRCVANHSLQESAQLPHLGGCWKAWSACQQCSLLPCDCQLVSQTALLGISSKPRACTVCCLQACGLGWSLVRPLFAVCKAVV